MEDQREGVPHGLRRIDTATRHLQLRRLLNDSGTAVVPGVVDALTARLVERAGFEACFITGAGVANAQLAMPDVGLLTLTEMVEQASRIAGATDIPLIVDGDTGHGGPLSVMRSVSLMESAGISGITLEDQAIPKRCGHIDGQRLVSTEDMLMRLDAAQRARRDPNFVIIARTDARSVEGFESALTRARRYVEAGADAIFIEAPQSVDELARIPRELPDHPLLVNIVEGGKTPHLSVGELSNLGYRFVLHANLLLRVTAKAAQEALAHLRAHGSSAELLDRVMDWEERQELVGLSGLDELEDDLTRSAQGRPQQT